MDDWATYIMEHTLTWGLLGTHSAERAKQAAERSGYRMVTRPGKREDREVLVRFVPNRMS